MFRILSPFWQIFFLKIHDFSGDGLPLSADDIKEREQEKRYYEARLSRYTFEAYAKDNMQEDAPTMADASFRVNNGLVQISKTKKKK